MALLNSDRGGGSGEPGPDRGDDPRPLPAGTGALGMTVFLLALTMLFAASLVAFVIFRLRATAWPPPGMPHLPHSLWVSTVLLLASSATLHWALVSARHDRAPGVRLGIGLTALLALAFLASQGWTWYELAQHGMPPLTQTIYSFLFYMLTALHGLHVVGGLAPLSVATVRGWRGAYTSQHHNGLKYAAMYWHFLDVVWLIIFAVLYLDVLAPLGGVLSNPIGT